MLLLINQICFLCVNISLQIYKLEKYENIGFLFKVEKRWRDKIYMVTSYLK